MGDEGGGEDGVDGLVVVGSWDREHEFVGSGKSTWMGVDYLCVCIP